LKTIKMCKEQCWVEKTEKASDHSKAFSVDSSKAEHFFVRVTNPRVQPFPCKDQGEETMAQIRATRSNNLLTQITGVIDERTAYPHRTSEPVGFHYYCLPLRVRWQSDLSECPLY